MKNTTLSGNLPNRNPISRTLLKNRKPIVDVIAALFILIFFYTAISKSVNINYTVATLRSASVFKPVAWEVAWGVVFLEYIIVSLLFFPKLKRFGLIASFILMTLFSLYIIYMKIVVPSLPCSCGGIISKLNWNQHLMLNIFLIVLALLGIWLTKKEAISSDRLEVNQIAFT